MIISYLDPRWQKPSPNDQEQSNARFVSLGSHSRGDPVCGAISDKKLLRQIWVEELALGSGMTREYVILARRLKSYLLVKLVVWVLRTSLATRLQTLDIWYNWIYSCGINGWSSGCWVDCYLVWRCILILIHKYFAFPLSGTGKDEDDTL
jgi:hypothetical protein